MNSIAQTTVTSERPLASAAQFSVITGIGLLRLLVVVTQIDAFMIHKAKDVSPDQKAAIESLLGRAIAENEEISIRSITLPSPPDWLKEFWERAR